MLVHLRRSLVMAVICLVFFGFVYAFAGTGVAQLLFKHQADGSLTANGSTLIGQNWSDTKCPGHPLGSCVFHGRPDDTGPYAANPNRTYPAETTPGRQWRQTASPGRPTSVPVPRCWSPNTKAFVAYWHKLGVDPTPDLVTTSGSGYDPDISPLDATVQIPDGVQGDRHLAGPTAHAHQATDASRAVGILWVSSYIDVLQLNEGGVGANLAGRRERSPVAGAAAPSAGLPFRGGFDGAPAGSDHVQR
jgi:K+-transporting ATPase ATPase C chain